MKNLTFILLFSLFITSLYAQKTKVYFTPDQGKDAFSHMERVIANAESYIYMTVYSWSLPTKDKQGKITGIIKAILNARNNDVPVRIVVRPELARSKRFIPKMKILEEAGVEIKKAHQGMHEKFIVVDDKFLVNGSANLSGGARDKYSENIVFHSGSQKKNDPINCLIKQFKYEFAILFNTSKDYKLNNEQENVAALEVIEPNCINKSYAKVAQLFSSSRNWIYTKNIRRTKRDVKQFDLGQNYTYKRRGGKKKQSWNVSDEIVTAIDEAGHSVRLCLNHFMIKDVAEAVLRAVKRGLKVELAVDNHEFKSGKSNVMSPYFVKKWKEIKSRGIEAPVRIKFYSLALTHSYAVLNHHKYILLDYGFDSEMLISGSHNISKQAEHNQYDNMVIYRGESFKNLYDRFYGEFLNLWSLNRDEADKPKEKLYNFFITKRRGSTRYPMHLVKKAVSLTWDEAVVLKRKVREISQPFFRTAKHIFKKQSDFWYTFSKFKECSYYNPLAGLFEKSVYNRIKKRWEIVPCSAK